jgi:hypothetical protein
MVFNSRRGYRGYGILWFIIILIFGVYFLNVPFGIVPIPEVILQFQDWIIFAGGIVVIFGGISYLRLGVRNIF